MPVISTITVDFEWSAEYVVELDEDFIRDSSEDSLSDYLFSSVNDYLHEKNYRHDTREIDNRNKKTLFIEYLKSNDFGIWYEDIGHVAISQEMTYVEDKDIKEFNESLLEKIYKKRREKKWKYLE